MFDISLNAIQELQRIRQHIHQYPELGFDVYNTADFIANELEKIGLQVKKGIGNTGLIADLKVAGAKRTIALRADMDALPIHEQNTCTYKSKIAGKAHMCGHDAHCAMVIVAAQQFVANKDKLNVNIRFIFQPSEEALPGGAPAMIADGALDEVNEIYGIHVLPAIDEGTMQISTPVALAGVDQFQINFHGTGGHASTPMKANDPIIMACQFVNQVQTIVSRNANSFDPLVVSVTAIEAGCAFNVIPAQASLKGAIRYLSSQAKEIAKKRLHEIANGIAATYQAKVQVNYIDGYPETRNDAIASARAITSAKRALGNNNVIESNYPWMASEDFSYFAKKIPACYAFLGVRNQTRGFTAMVHEPTFDLSNEAMLNGVKYYVSLISSFEKES
ncbi:MULTISPECIES: M20 metallopeptidase family protein [Francisella]|uniref:Amidohydrolase n=1 Tax=Francisella opportunistica TaxID=2016517 RepID=A0A345JQU0_9GAMM|nr:MULTISPECIES: amidohydrolase [Francisella]APC91395.1 N-acetyl-L,L-diaminopimelate deacetylase [Francisella sp. MA067296]AXH29686.1 amidohydrolase [Francisella opportunistica]AXH31336.1 amidohydrolase [Francisella opportunistica]AXH32982.1 amidohydrolase [Francisella opportunistica]